MVSEAGRSMASFTASLSPPPPFPFDSPDLWPKWKRRFEQYRIAAGLSKEREERLVVLGNISIFWKYRDISFDNILYRGKFSISKYHISILIVFIVFMYATHEVYITWI